jgi:hypothetical protein
MLSSLMNDQVTLVKQDGTRIGKIKAAVQPKLILTDDPKLPIEEGDHFERVLPSGLRESYEIIEAGFFGGMAGMPAHFQSKVRKETKLVSPVATSTHVVYKITGNNNRINNQSTDSSTNVVNIETSTLFVKMKQAVNDGVTDREMRDRIQETIAAMETAAGQPSFVTQYNRFVAVAADHLTLLTPFLPALAQLMASALGG